MPVTFLVPGPLRPYAAGQRKIVIEPSPATVADALEMLWKQCPGMRDRMMTEQSQIREHINLFVGNENIRYTGGLQTPLPDGAEIAIIPAISGGVAGAYATIDGLRVYYELHGGEPAGATTPVVLLHGGLMSIETAFAEDLLPRLSRKRPVIAIELQGHGHTGDRAGPIQIGRMIDDTAGVLAHLGVKQAHFFGHSLGGMISMGMAIRHPDAVRSVTALGAGYHLEGMLPEIVKMQRDPSHRPSPELIPLLPTEAEFDAWRASFQRNAPDPAAFDSVIVKLNKMLAEWEGWSTDELRTVRAPVLLVIGDHDFVRIEHAAKMAALIPNAQLAVLPGTTHMTILQRGAWIEPMFEARLPHVTEPRP